MPATARTWRVVALVVAVRDRAVVVVLDDLALAVLEARLVEERLDEAEADEAHDGRDPDRERAPSPASSSASGRRSATAVATTTPRRAP